MSRKKKNRTRKLNKLNREQLEKLEQDARCFIHVADIADQLRQKEDPKSDRFLGYTTVMQTNFGMGLELKLKALQVRTIGGYFVTPNHKLVGLFDRLDKETQAKLDWIFEEIREVMPISQSLYMRGFIPLKEKGDVHVAHFEILPVFRKRGFRGLLESFDQMQSDKKGLYGRRYSFEDYDKKQLWSDLNVSPLLIMRIIDKLIETLDEPTFPE